jgi:hypothetical protein
MGVLSAPFVLLLAAVGAAGAQSPLTLEHSGGGPISAVMASVISKLPPLEPTGPVKNATKLVRTVKLSGHYTADVVLRLPSYTRLQLDGSLTATPDLNAGEDTNVQGYLGTGMVYATGEMIGVEGGVFNCSGWKPGTGLPHNGTSTLAGILFNSVLGGERTEPCRRPGWPIALLPLLCSIQNPVRKKPESMI